MAQRLLCTAVIRALTRNTTPCLGDQLFGFVSLSAQAVGGTLHHDTGTATHRGVRGGVGCRIGAKRSYLQVIDLLLLHRSSSLQLCHGLGQLPNLSTKSWGSHNPGFRACCGSRYGTTQHTPAHPTRPCFLQASRSVLLRAVFAPRLRAGRPSVSSQASPVCVTHTAAATTTGTATGTVADTATSKRTPTHAQETATHNSA